MTDGPLSTDRSFSGVLVPRLWATRTSAARVAPNLFGGPLPAKMVAPDAGLSAWGRAASI